MTRVRVRRPDPPMDDEPDPGVPLTVPASNELVLGIDASLTATGTACVIAGRLWSDVWSPPKGMRGAERLAWFHDKLTGLLRTARPSLVVLEGYGFGAKSQAHSLGELGGVLKLALQRSGSPVMIVPPTVLKLFATGKGNAEKDAVSKELFKRFGVDLMNNNAVDAAGLAIIGLAHLLDDFPGLTVPQKRALTKVELVL